MYGQWPTAPCWFLWIIVTLLRELLRSEQNTSKTVYYFLLHLRQYCLLQDFPSNQTGDFSHRRHSRPMVPG
jgi:hypothetical protein